MASRYNVADYDSDEERAQNPNAPPPPNLMSACRFVMSLLQASNMNYAVMGGFGLLLRGSLRLTRDVDIAVEAPMGQLWPIVEPQARHIYSHINSGSRC